MKVTYIFIIIHHVKIVSRDWINEVHHSMLLCTQDNVLAAGY